MANPLNTTLEQEVVMDDTWPVLTIWTGHHTNEFRPWRISIQYGGIDLNLPCVSFLFLFVVLLVNRYNVICSREKTFTHHIVNVPA